MAFDAQSSPARSGLHGALSLLTTGAVLWTLACGGASVREPEPTGNVGAEAPANPDVDRIRVSVEPDEVRSDPEFFESLADDPFRFYRFINVAFSDAVCVHFDPWMAQMPVVNLHGDAHIEQYAVTNVGRGMADYDDSSTGPAILDILRFAVSLRLAANASGFPERGDEAVSAFLDGYRRALDDNTYEAPEPALCSELRATFAPDRQPFLDSATGLMVPLDEDEASEVRAAFEAYGARLAAVVPGFDDPARFEIVALGGLDIGIGSRLDRKFLIRAAGDSDDPLDDAIIEFKEVRDLSGIRCIQGTSGGGAFRVLMGLTRIAQDDDPYLAAVPMAADGLFGERSFWARSWFDHYREMDVRESFSESARLAEVAFDVGVQLGVGHVLHIAAPLDAQLREEQLTLVQTLEGEIRTAVDLLTRQTLDAHEQFARQVRAAAE